MHGVFHLIRTARQELRAAALVVIVGNRQARGGFAAGRVPVHLELPRCCGGGLTRQIEGQVGPRRPPGAPREVFVGKVSAAGPKPLAIHDHPLAMIA